MANITSLLKYSLKTNIVKSILFEIISNTSRYFYTFGQTQIWPTVIGPRGASVFTAERTNNVVRITTKTPHGLLKNDKIIVSLNSITELNNPQPTGAVNISSIEKVSGVVTMTTETNHGFSLGDTITVNSDIDAVDGVFTITQIVDNQTLRYSSLGGDINTTSTIDGTVSLYTSFDVLDVINDITFTYLKNGTNIITTQDTGQVFSVERQVISSEEDPPSISDSYPYELEVRNNITFMKLIDSNDVSIVVPRINWQPGITYDMFDEYSGDNLAFSGANSLAQAQFYVLTDEFNVYKCIFNNNDQASSIKPISTSPTSEELTLADGYIWKFMYTIPISLRNKFLTSQYMPVLSALTNQFYSSGSITDYSIVSSGYGYIKNSYSVKAIDIVDNGSGYTELSAQSSQTFNIVSLQRTNNVMTINIDEVHNIAAERRGALSISCNISSVEVSGNVIPLNIDGLQIIKTTTSTAFIIDNAGADIPLILAGGTVSTTGAVITFPIPTTGVQAKAYVSEYGSGGTIDKITVTETGSGYLTPPVPEIEMLNGLQPSKPLEISIDYGSLSSSGYTEVLVQGDGYNANNPFSLKQVIIFDDPNPDSTDLNGGRGIFQTIITGEIFSFPEPDLPNGRKPKVQVNFTDIVKQYNVILSERTSLGTVILTVNLTSGNTIQYSVGDEIIVNLNTNTAFNGTHTITAINGNQISYTLAGSTISAVSDSGTVVNSENIFGYEVQSVDVIDEGYGYSKPLKFGDDPTGRYFSVFASNLTSNGFNCDLDEPSQKNSAVLLPLINSNGEIESLQIIEPGIGYTYAFIDVRGYGVDSQSGNLVLMNSDNTPGFVKANIQLRFSVGDINTRQSTVELFAKTGSISAIKVLNGGSGYTSSTRIVVLGDGSGCQAIPEIGVGGKIEKITILNSGVGYTNATAYISGAAENNDPLSITNAAGAGAELRTILSPRGGHGKDAISELYARSIYFTSRLANEKNKGIITRTGSDNLPSPNDYRQVTILKNPFSFNKNEYFRKNVGSSCILIGCDFPTQNTPEAFNNTIAFNQISQDDILEHSSASGVKKFIVVEKEEVNNKYYLVLQTIDNFIPETNSVFTKTVGTNVYSLIATYIENPDFNKFSGEMLYINNRTNFTPSEEQSVVVSTLINF